MANNVNQYPNPMGQNGPNVQMAVNQALADQKKKKKKKKLIIIGVIVAVIILLVAVASSGSDDDTATTEPINGAAASTTVAGKETTQGEQKIKPGTAITVDNLKISYISCNPNYKDYDEYSKPSSGKKVIRAEFEFENLSDYDKALDGITCYADNQKCEEYYYADDYASPVLETISAGRTLKGVVYYEVPTNAKDIELEFEADFWSSDKTIFVVE